SRDTVGRLGLTRGEFILVTLHRPQNVDQKETLSSIVEALVNAGRPVVFPVHPRTRKNLAAFGLWDRLSAKVKAIEPVDYLDFIALLMASAKVVTDSGAVQKEAYFFGVPCVTLRDETEWMETMEDGWNALVGAETEDILHAILNFNREGIKSKSFGDGHAAEHIARILHKFVSRLSDAAPQTQILRGAGAFRTSTMSAPSALVLKCPNCGEVVPHRVLRGKIAGKDEIGFEGVVRCSKWDAISNVVTREPTPSGGPLSLSCV